ncbi:unnamed protein product [Psylliodes chrysocephalus]|uniref:Uncharacterized protein n=1 Tax=Psylliodes chrysocephalus TaxID=3402493 RepID=A0A9P0GJK2_9CUCU|nr:unnamed protein product [Psylliodes chrysocephala]
MKTITLILFQCTIQVLSSALKSPIRAPLSIITLNDITPSERRHIAYLEQKLERSKRSGSDSGAILNIIKTSIGNGIKKKIGQLTKASAAASGEFSRTSSNKGEEHYHYTNHVPHHVEHEPSFDFWYLKKSVLNTLLQAVKAIKGGVIAIKGQLIKGGGKLVSASGKLVSSQGDAITKLGKTIATNAILVPYHSSSSNKGHYHEEYEVENHYPGPSHEDIYHNGPSGSSLDYHVTEDHPHHHDEGSGGLLILKKITDVNQGPQIHHRQSHYVQPPSASNLFSKLFSASSSLDPHKPELYPDKFPPNDYTDEVYKEPSYNKDYELASLASDNTPQEIPSASTVSKHRIRLSPNDQSKNYFNQNSNNLIISPLKNQIKTVPQTSDSSFKGSETNNVANNENPDYNTKTNYVSEVTKPLSIYLETPKMNYLLPPTNYDSPTTNYEQSALSDFNLNQVFRANYENRFNNKTSHGQELVELSLTPSITYEIKEDGTQRIV